MVFDDEKSKIEYRKSHISNNKGLKVLKEDLDCCNLET